MMNKKHTGMSRILIDTANVISPVVYMDNVKKEPINGRDDYFLPEKTSNLTLVFKEINDYNGEKF